MLSQEQIQEAIAKAITPEILEQLGVKQATGKRTLTLEKPVKDIILEKKLSMLVKDNGNGTCSSLCTMLAVKASEDGEKELTREDYRPTKAQLKLINKITLETQKENSGFVITFQATNSVQSRHKGVDRSGQAFSEKALKRMATYAEGNVIPYLFASEADWGDHTWKAINAYGYVIKAYVKDGALFYETYFPENDETKSVLTRLFSAMTHKVSVGFFMSYEDMLCSSCEKCIFDKDCKHYPGEPDEKGLDVFLILDDVENNVEFSGVAVPCQQDAGSRREGEGVREGAKSLAEAGPLIPKKQVSLNVTLDEAFKDLSEETTNKIKELLSKEAENLDTGKITNGKDTIEDNTLMSDSNTNEAADQGKQVETPEVKTEGVTVDPNAALLAAVAQFSESVLGELKALKEEKKVEADAAEEKKQADLSDSVTGVKAELATLSESLKSEVNTLKTEIEALKKELALAKSVPGSKALADSANASVSKDALSANTDALIGPLLQ